jgi:arginine decarboxylase-like protein
MKLALTLVIALAACGGKSSDSTTTPTSGSGDTAADDMVDPTLPSWAPRSCKAYHTVVVKAVDCTEMEQAARDEIKAKYEASNTAWHDLQDAKQEQIDQIGTACTADAQQLRGQAAGKCGIAAM